MNRQSIRHIIFFYYGHRVKWLTCRRTVLGINPVLLYILMLKYFKSEAAAHVLWVLFSPVGLKDLTSTWRPGVFYLFVFRGLWSNTSFSSPPLALIEGNCFMEYVPGLLVQVSLKFVTVLAVQYCFRCLFQIIFKC